MSYTSVVIEPTWVNRNWWCADCRVPTDLDRHGRCGICGSDAVDMMSRPNKLGINMAMQPGSIALDDVSQYVSVAQPQAVRLTSQPQSSSPRVLVCAQPLAGL